MTDAPNFESAMTRLSLALQLLEASVERRLKSAQNTATLRNEVQQLDDDRSQLADELDAAQARSERLSTANRDVSRRLVTAMETVRSVIEGHGG